MLNKIASRINQCIIKFTKLEGGPLKRDGDCLMEASCTIRTDPGKISVLKSNKRPEGFRAEVSLSL